MTYRCAIAPLDQSATSLGWHPGSYISDPCRLFATCLRTDDGLRFLANAGSPVVAPFPGTAVGNVFTPAIDAHYARPITLLGMRVLASGPVERGALLGRVEGSRGAIFSAPFIEGLFSELGFDIVGGARPDMPGYRLVPVFGGRLLARTGGAADCVAGGVRGLEALFGGGFGGVAPTGYIEPNSSAYERYGPSRQTNVGPPVVDEPRSSGSGGGGWALLAAAFVAGVAWIARGR